MSKNLDEMAKEFYATKLGHEKKDSDLEDAFKAGYLDAQSIHESETKILVELIENLRDETLAMPKAAIGQVLQNYREARETKE